MTDPVILTAIERDFIPYAHPGFSGVNSYRVVSAEGKLLAKHDRWPSEVIRAGMLAWGQLPEAERKPRAVNGVPKVKEYPKPPEPPKNGLILRTHVRALQRDEDGDLTLTGPLTVGDGAYDIKPEPSLDHVWLTEAEWKSLIPFEPTVGDVLKVRPEIAERIAVFHLLDRGIGCKMFLWEKAKGEMKVKVVEVTSTRLRMELTGAAKIGANADYPVRFQGRLDVDRKKGEFTRFDMLAMSKDDGDMRQRDEQITRYDYWYRLSAKSKLVMAIAFELIEGTKPMDRCPPYGIMCETDRVFNRPYFK